jgi:ABC-type Fe3+ transport system substrate-binding protein
MSLRLVQTCGACPEQYDVFDGDEQVGYMRLRHGGFTVSYPDVMGETVYSASPEGDGIFEPDERDHFIAEGLAAITEAIRESRNSR